MFQKQFLNSCVFLVFFVFCEQSYMQDRNEVPGTDCHGRLGVNQQGRISPVYWLYASDGWASKARLYNDEAWVSDLPVYVEDHQPYYSWIQVSLLVI